MADNEFAEAAARMFAKRTIAPLGGAPEIVPPDPADAWEPSESSSWRALLSGRVALLLIPFVVAVVLGVWYLRPQPAQPAPPRPAPERKVAEVKTESGEPVEMPRAPPAIPPTVRREVVEEKPAPVTETATVVPPMQAEGPAAPLSRDEVKDLQGKLGAIGFDAGPADGVVGPQTQAALRRYAQARGLTNPDATREVLSRLKSEAPGGR